MPTANEAFRDALIRHQIGLVRMSPATTRKVLALLQESEADLKDRILARELKGMSTARLEATLRAIQSTRSDAWKKTGLSWEQEMTELTKAEALFMDATLNAVSPAILHTTLPGEQRLSGLVDSTMFEGDTLSGWAERQEAADLFRIEQGIRIGITQGQTSDEIAARIIGTPQFNETDGYTQLTRNNAQTVTRTAINALTNAARQEYYDDNEELFDEDIFIATLDSRTTILCASQDHRTFPRGEGPVPPLHWNCRSIRMALIDGKAIGERPARNFTKRQLLREFAEEQDIEVVTNRSDLPRGLKKDFDLFARGRMRDLTGQVPAALSYQEWLKSQSAAFQDDVLGPSRGKLFREGGFTLDRFVSRNGDLLTLDQLKQRDAATLKELGIH